MVLYAASILLLLISGAAKVARPRATAQALVDLLPVGRWVLRAQVWRRVARAVGIVEIVVAASGQPGLVAVVYALFGVVVALQLRAGSTGSCGCVGGDSPATPLHLVLNIAFAGSALVAPGLTRDPLELGLAVVLAGLCLGVMTALADLSTAIRARA